VKRKTHKRIWQDKLSAAGLQYLEAQRRAKLKGVSAQRKPGTRNPFEELISRLYASWSNSEYKKLLKELEAKDPAAAHELESEMRDFRSPVEVPSFGVVLGTIFEMLETVGTQGRFAIAFQLTAVTKLVWERFLDVRKRHFGNAELSNSEVFWVLGTTMETIGRSFRTGDEAPLKKGRANVELLDTLRVIRKHEIQRLSYRELTDALQYALIHVPDEEWLRLSFIAPHEDAGSSCEDLQASVPDLHLRGARTVHTCVRNHRMSRDFLQVG
jgi:hypothetical protein